ncbi:Sodium/hydrogen exchanger 4 [Datura stramonium]|uniref:Sodium/hydrogen exchanger 4 n=1 Tax=Datura stramonium TaxID=4076 RepID=A0ABS8SBC7_DATST|nr:Sodium/hydrogen exchanger 4 [Datura stramonium]
MDQVTRFSADEDDVYLGGIFREVRVSTSGTIILLISKGKSSHILRFNEEVFFIYLLPPIIFNAGFQVKKKQFFHLLNYVVLGYWGFISSRHHHDSSWWLFPKFNFNGLTVRDYLGIGAIFSSTDTVCTLQVLHQDETPLLYSLVFGEGVVNDATSVVLFNAVQKIDVDRFNGWSAAGLLTSYILRAYTLGGKICVGVSVDIYDLESTSSYNSSTSSYKF